MKIQKRKNDYKSKRGKTQRILNLLREVSTLLDSLYFNDDVTELQARKLEKQFQIIREFIFDEVLEHVDDLIIAAQLSYDTELKKILNQFLKEDKKKKQKHGKRNNDSAAR